MKTNDCKKAIKKRFPQIKELRLNKGVLRWCCNSADNTAELSGAISNYFAELTGLPIQWFQLKTADELIQTISDELLAAKEREIRDLIGMVRKGFHTGLYLWGLGARGKSWLVEDELEKLDAKYSLINAGITDAGLLAELAKDGGQGLFVFDDVESIMEQKKSFGTLRSALWSQDSNRPMRRLIKRKTASDAHSKEFVFTGGIILIANTPINKVNPQLAALATRIPDEHYEITEEQARARLRQIAKAGFKQIESDACLFIAETIIQIGDNKGVDLDLRMWRHACNTYLAWKQGVIKTHWTTMLESQMVKEIVGKSKAARTAEEIEIARRIDAMKLKREEKYAMYSKMCGGSKATYYRRVKGEGDVE